MTPAAFVGFCLWFVTLLCVFFAYAASVVAKREKAEGDLVEYKKTLSGIGCFFYLGLMTFLIGAVCIGSMFARS